MYWLILVSLVWAPSPGLIRHWLGGVDPALVALIRVALALVVLAPFCRPRGLRAREVGWLIVIGAVQFGLMYVCYIGALAHLQAFEVAVLTIFTPLLVCIFEDLAARRIHWWPFAAAAVATVGAGIVLHARPLTSASWSGVALVQLSNACFAFGQVAYRRWRFIRPDISDARVFGLLYFGAVIAALPASWSALGTLDRLTSAQWLTLAYLGIVASGLCFFLWNRGAIQTGAGSLAVANNLKIPLMVACSLLVFGESTDLSRLLLGGALVVAAGLIAEWNERRARRFAAAPART